MNSPGGRPDETSLVHSVEAEVRVGNEQGLHTRPCYALGMIAGQFQSDISIVLSNGADRAYDAKSMLDWASMALEFGSYLTIRAVGSDAARAVATIKEAVECGDHEEMYKLYDRLARENLWLPLKERW